MEELVSAVSTAQERVLRLTRELAEANEQALQAQGRLLVAHQAEERAAEDRRLQEAADRMAALYFAHGATPLRQDAGLLATRFLPVDSWLCVSSHSPAEYAHDDLQRLEECRQHLVVEWRALLLGVDVDPARLAAGADHAVNVLRPSTVVLKVG